MVAMDPTELDDFLAAAFPASRVTYRVTRSDDHGIEVAQPADSIQLRPGGTISGPTLMTLADTVAYLAVVARIGPEPLTVTSHLAIDFLRKPSPGGLRATGEILKLGRRQAVIAIRIYGDFDTDGTSDTGSDGGEMVAYATSTYALPSKPTVPRADLENP